VKNRFHGRLRNTGRRKILDRVGSHRLVIE